VWLVGEYVAEIGFAYVLALACAIAAYCVVGACEPRFDPEETDRARGGHPVQATGATA
jgi:hypothetical protein